jgi:hypothetical protein
MSFFNEQLKLIHGEQISYRHHRPKSSRVESDSKDSTFKVLLIHFSADSKLDLKPSWEQ